MQAFSKERFVRERCVGSRALRAEREVSSGAYREGRFARMRRRSPHQAGPVLPRATRVQGSACEGAGSPSVSACSTLRAATVPIS